MLRIYRKSLSSIAFGMLALLSSATGTSGEGGRRPNILFIFTDDHSAKVISSYEGAYPMANTPNIDRLAARGVRFAAGYMGAWCMPSRASLLTGLHPHRIETMRMTGANPRSTYDPEVCRFWPSVFRQHGYQTAQIGKWHTGTDAGWGRDWDFQRVWNRPDNADTATRYYGPQPVDFNGQRRMVDGYSTDNYTRWAVDYIRGEGRAPDRPWYLWLCYGAVHTPTIPAERHEGLLRDTPVEPPAAIFGPRPGKPAYLERTQAWSRTSDGVIVDRAGKPHAEWMRQVHECLMSVDEGVGELLRALEETGQLEDTLVVFTSDQGFANGEHGIKQKLAPYEATYASPLIVSRPGTLPEGKYSPHTVNAPDVVVTFFAQAGIPLPWKMHGRDFTPLLLDPENAAWVRPTLYLHTGQDYGTNVLEAVAGRRPAELANVPYYAALRQGDLKYVRYLAIAETEELYDLRDDPEELANLAGDPRHRATLRRFRAALLAELRAADAEFVSEMAEPKTPND